MRPLTIRIINRFDRAGGAEMVVFDQLREFLDRGHDAALLVGAKSSDHPAVVSMPGPGEGEAAAHVWEEALRGADIVHLHNAHGGYFDPAWLVERCTASVVLTLHDQFHFTGGCVHERGCPGWRTGCASCPQLIPDTAEAWREKRALWRRLKPCVVSPASWIHERAQQSILAAPGARFFNIANGLDIGLFVPRPSSPRCRAALGVGEGELLLLVSAARLRQNPSKDWPTLFAALGLAEPRLDRPATLVVLGEDGEEMRIGCIRIVFLGFLDDRERTAELYAEADIFLHVSLVETFSLAILEAMAAGCAIIATDAGGISEQLGAGEVGAITPVGKAEPLAEVLLTLASNASRRAALGRAARARVESRWSLEHHVDAHLALYRLLGGRL